MPCTCRRYLSRRAVLIGFSAAASVAACSENAEIGRQQLVLVDDAQLAALADSAWGEITGRMAPAADPAVQRRFAGIGQAMVAVSGRQDLDWRFAVLDSPDINAFVLPNGRVAALRGLMEFAADDAEIASVVGHEIGHLLARHPAERVSQQLAVEAGVSLAQILLAQGENADRAADVAAALGAGAVYGVLLPYSRSHELEADRLGVELMRRAGYDPAAALRFFERMAAAGAAQDKPPEVLSTHPADEQRIAVLRDAVEAARAAG